MSSSRSTVPRRLSIDLHLTSAVKREVTYASELDSPYASHGEQSTPTTPNGHPVANPFQKLLRPQPATPLPIVKILPLCIARMAEGLGFAVIFRTSARAVARSLMA